MRYILLSGVNQSHSFSMINKCRKTETEYGISRFMSGEHVEG